MGHLTFQCRNHLGAVEQRVASSNSSSSSVKFHVEVGNCAGAEIVFTCCCVWSCRIVQVKKTAKMRKRKDYPHTVRHHVDAAEVVVVVVVRKYDVAGGRRVVVAAVLLDDVATKDRRAEVEVAAWVLILRRRTVNNAIANFLCRRRTRSARGRRRNTKVGRKNTESPAQKSRTQRKSSVNEKNAEG